MPHELQGSRRLREIQLGLPLSLLSAMIRSTITIVTLLALAAPSAQTTVTAHDHSHRRTCLPKKNVATHVIPVKVHQYSWATSLITNKIAEIILHEELGFEVTPVEIEDNTFEVYRQLAEGKADLAFEVWPYGKEVCSTGFGFVAFE